MAPPNEVVDLLSSDEEEEEQSVVIAAAKKVSSVTETIDLCESSEDEEDDDSNNAKLPPAAVHKMKGTTTLVQKSKASTADGTGLSFREASKSPDFARKVSPSAEQQQAEPLTNAAHYLDRAKQAAAARRTRELDSDDDDDNELFSFDTGLIRKKQPPQETPAAIPRNPYQKSCLQQTSGYASASVQKPAPKNIHTIRRKSAPGAATAYAAQEKRKPPEPAHRKSAPPLQAPNDDDDSDDDDDDDLFNFSTGLLRPPSASNSKRAAASSAVSQQQVVVNNPYLASKPRASFAAATRTPPASTRPIPFPYPKLTERAKQYPDERARFLLAFWQYARANCTRHSFERPKLDAVAKRVVRLAVGTDHPIRSLEELVRSSGGTGSSSVNAHNKVRDDFRQELAQGGFDRLVTPVVTATTTSTSSNSNQRYYSISEACLVTLLMHAETARGRGSGSTTDEQLPAALLSEKDNWMALVDMIPAIDRKLLPVCPGRLTRRDDPDWGAEHYLQQSTRSMEFLQVSKLESKDVGPFIKRHSVKGSIHYELLPAGYERAMRIRTRQFPEPEGHYRCSKIRSLQDVDPKYPNICLGVDMREGGGGAKTLHQMCNTLEMMKCPYFVGSLSIGDYVFFTSKGDGRSGGRMDYLCPILVERKSIQDVAMSIHDGRWTSQKQRMYKAQYVFGYENCRMVYIIEGNENKQTVNGGYVGARWYNVDKEKLHQEIENLEKEGFDVLRTTSVENSMMELSRWVSRVARKVAEGTMKPEYTYAEFKDQVAKIPKQTDFSRLAKYYVEQKAERAAAASAAAAADDDSDIEVWSNAGKHNAAASRGKKPAPAARLPQQKRPAKKRKSSVTGCDHGSDDYSGFSQEQHRSAKKRKSSVNGGGHGSDDYSGCSQQQKRPAKKRKSNDNGGLVGGGGGAGDDDIDYSAWETKALKAECEAVGLKKSGTRDECIQLLKGPRPPAVWLERKRMKEYVPPRHNVAATALLVALYLHEQAAGPGDSGMTKDELYVKAESLNITKNPFSGGTTQTGPYHYTGWASMAPLLEGDPALVVKRKKRYKLTTSGRIAGVPFAEAMHSWCHEHGNCPCQDHDYYG